MCTGMGSRVIFATGKGEWGYPGYKLSSFKISQEYEGAGRKRNKLNHGKKDLKTKKYPFCQSDGSAKVTVAQVLLY